MNRLRKGNKFCKNQWFKNKKKNSRDVIDSSKFNKLQIEELKLTLEKADQLIQVLKNIPEEQDIGSSIKKKHFEKQIFSKHQTEKIKLKNCVTFIDSRSRGKKRTKTIKNKKKFQSSSQKAHNSSSYSKLYQTKQRSITKGDKRLYSTPCKEIKNKELVIPLKLLNISEKKKSKKPNRRSKIVFSEHKKHQAFKLTRRRNWRSKLDIFSTHLDENIVFHNSSIDSSKDLSLTLNKKISTSSLNFNPEKRMINRRDSKKCRSLVKGSKKFIVMDRSLIKGIDKHPESLSLPKTKNVMKYHPINLNKQNALRSNINPKTNNFSFSEYFSEQKTKESIEYSNEFGRNRCTFLKSCLLSPEKSLKKRVQFKMSQQKEKLKTTHNQELSQNSFEGILQKRDGKIRKMKNTLI
jgi:hypothetical protein